MVNRYLYIAPVRVANKIRFIGSSLASKETHAFESNNLIGSESNCLKVSDEKHFEAFEIFPGWNFEKFERRSLTASDRFLLIKK